jgi:D-serine deaminase-like pyridoxal phosphate-dependent protein
VGLGLPLLKLEAEMTGGSMEVFSKAEAEHPADHGTVVTARFVMSHIDCPPLGDVVETVLTLIQGHPDTDFLFCHTVGDRDVLLDTRELRQILEDVPLNSYEVLQWIEAFLREQYQ